MKKGQFYDVLTAKRIFYFQNLLFVTAKTPQTAKTA